MKNYTITVNGNIYDVAVEENGGATTLSAPRAAAPVQAPTPVQGAAAPAPAQTAKPAAASNGAQGAVKVNAPMPGKILGIKAEAGQAVKKGQVILVLEAMKMENEIVAPQDGTIASLNVSVGDMIESGALLATLN